MIPKTETALAAIEEGVRAVVILDGRVPNACLLELFTDHGAGSLIRRTAPRVTPARALTTTAMEGLRASASRHHLFISGAFHSAPEHGLPENGTLYLLSPDEPGFWAHIKATPEFLDGTADPVDRWSARVVTQIAQELGGTAYLLRRPTVAPVYPMGAGLRSGAPVSRHADGA